MRNKQRAQKKKTKSKRRKYDTNLLEVAIQAVKEDGMPLLQAAKDFGVPKSTLWDHFNGRCQKPFGGQTLFTKEEEEKIADHIEAMSQVGYEYSRAQIRRYATAFAHLLDKASPDKMLAYHWVIKFINRNERIKQILPKIRSERRNPTDSEIDHYYSELERIMNRYDLKARPSLLYAVSDVVLGPSKTKQTRKKKRKKKAKKVPDKDEEKGSANKVKALEDGQITVMACGNASGLHIPPFVIYKDCWFRNKMLEGGDIYGMSGLSSDTGMCDSKIFISYLEDHVLRHATRHDEGEESDDEDSGYILVFYDGMLPYINTAVIDYALSKKIVLFVLPPHCHSLLRPIAGGCFSSFKDTFEDDYISYRKRYPAKALERSKINQLLCKSYLRGLRPQYLGATFAGWGVFPFLRRMVVFSEDDDNSEDDSSASESEVDATGDTTEQLEVMEVHNNLVEVEQVTDDYHVIPSISTTPAPPFSKIFQHITKTEQVKDDETLPPTSDSENVAVEQNADIEALVLKQQNEIIDNIVEQVVVEDNVMYDMGGEQDVVEVKDESGQIIRYVNVGQVDPDVQVFVYEDGQEMIVPKGAVVFEVPAEEMAPQVVECEEVVQ